MQRMDSRGAADARGGRSMALSGSRLRVLAILQIADTPLTLASLSQQTGSHPNTLRDHLAALMASGLVERVAAPREGAHRGRPPLAYRPSPDRPVPADAASLLGALASEVRGLADAEDVSLRAGRRWGATLAGAPDRMAGLAELGFSPLRIEGGVVLRACPVGGVAAAIPEVICLMHLGALQAALQDDGAQLIPGGHPEGCLLRLPLPR